MHTQEFYFSFEQDTSLYQGFYDIFAMNNTKCNTVPFRLSRTGVVGKMSGRAKRSKTKKTHAVIMTLVKTKNVVKLDGHLLMHNRRRIAGGSGCESALG